MTDRHSAVRQAAVDGILGNFAKNITMRLKRKLEVLFFGWLAAIALLMSPAAAADDGRAGKRIASDMADRAAPAEPKIKRPSNEILAPRFSDLEQRLFAQIHDGSFGDFSLLEAGLVAGGVERCDELRRYCSRFDTLVDALRRSGKVRGTPRQRAEALFTFLHQSILTGGYRLQASDLRQVFDHGRFNCVTASLLFNCLAAGFDLKAVGLELPGHAMSRLDLPDETLDIETTCPRWFSRSDPPPAAAGRRPLRQISEVELVATIYYNRGVDLLAEKRFAEAVAANAKAVRLDPQNATAKGNFLAAINNWAIDLGTSGDYPKAAELLRLGLATDPSYGAFHANYVQLFHQWSEDLCRSGRCQEAVRLLAQAAKEQPEEKFFQEATIEILRRWAKR